MSLTPCSPAVFHKLFAWKCLGAVEISATITQYLQWWFMPNPLWNTLICFINFILDKSIPSLLHCQNNCIITSWSVHSPAFIVFVCTFLQVTVNKRTPTFSDCFFFIIHSWWSVPEVTNTNNTTCNTFSFLLLLCLCFASLFSLPSSFELITTQYEVSHKWKTKKYPA